MPVSNSVKLIAMLVIGIVIGVGIGYAVFAAMAPKGEELVEYTIGIVLPLSGANAGYGQDQKYFCEMAAEDLNKLMEKTGSHVRFKLNIQDDTSTPEGGLAAVTSLVDASGVKIIAGMPLSSVVLGVKSFVDSKKVVVLSSRSSSEAIAIPDDYIYRVGASVSFQWTIGARYFRSLGVDKIVVIYRNDPFGKSIWDAVSKYGKEQGFPVAGISFEPEQPDYAAEVTKLSKTVSDMGVEKVGVMASVWEAEILNMLSHAKTDPILGKVPWYISTVYPTLLPPKAPTDIGDFCVQTKMLSHEPKLKVTPDVQALMDRAQAKLGHVPSTEHAYAYDGVILAGMSILVSGKYDGEALKTTVPLVAKMLYGVTGQLELNENGDRLREGRAWSQAIKKPDGTYAWMLVAEYDPLSDQFTTYPQPIPRA
jgi:branched-chain amino acid transport system substrate-binding protein